MQDLYTKEAATIPEIPWNVYPRPQMKRERWLCLNGTWELSFGGAVQTIRVPYCPENRCVTGGRLPCRRTGGACASCCTSAP